VCPTCRTRMHPVVEQAGTKIKCPDCGVVILVPRPSPVKQKSTSEPREIGDYGVSAPVERPPLETHYGKAQAELRTQPVSPPPRWTFLSGVFSFPWYPSSIARWVYLSLGCILVGELPVAILLLSGVGNGEGIGSIAVLSLGFFAMTLFWLSLWTFAYAAACCLAVVQDTAAGNDEVLSWPEPNWKDWVWKLLYVGYMLVLAALPGQLLAWSIPNPSFPFWIPPLGTIFLLFPLFTLCSQEADSPWVPLSPIVLRTMVTLWWGWLTFYAESAVLAAGWLGLFWLGIFRHPYLTMLVASPLLSALLLIYARLLGRLAWRAEQSC